MTIVDIGVRELQRDTSRVIRDVEETGTAYRITIQGRPTSVLLERSPAQPAGASLSELRESALYKPKADGVVDAQLAELESSRDRAGRIGTDR